MFLFPVFVIFLNRSRWQCVGLGYAGDFGEGVLHIFHRVFVISGFIPDAVIPLSENICDIIHFYVWVF